MKKTVVIAIIVAVAMIITGAVMSVCAWASLGNAYFEGRVFQMPLNDDFSSINIECNTKNIWIFCSEDDLGRIEYTEYGNEQISCEIVDGVLEITAYETLKWYDYISIAHNDFPRISLYLPYKEYIDLKMRIVSGDVYVSTKIPFENVNIKTDSADIRFNGQANDSLSLESVSGDITISNTNLSLEKVILKTTSGDIEANSISASSEINIKTTSGNVEANSIVALAEIKIKTTSGDIEFASIDAPRLDLESVSGDMEGTVLTKKRINADTTSGDINVKSYDSAKEVCDASTVSGDIEIRTVFDHP